MESKWTKAGVCVWGGQDVSASASITGFSTNEVDLVMRLWRNFLKKF